MSWRWVLLPISLWFSSAVSHGDEPPRETCTLSIELVDDRTGQPMSGVVRARDANGKAIGLPSLVARGQGIEAELPIHDWWVLPKPTTVKVPAAVIEFSAVGGLETDLAVKRVDLTGEHQAALRIPLARFYKSRSNGYVAGNTHLHLMKLSKREADRYLREVPLADGLDIVFLSYLERALADLDYTSNNYTPADLARLSHDHLRFGHGEEHRHNFGSHGEGYGHILLLDIPYIIQPVSIGPGIMKKGADSPPLQAGIDKARQAGGKVIWAHNLYGFEDIPNWVTGRVHANNIFDGSAKGSYKDTYYRYLNIGLKVPFSTGTDWFIYDFSRVYVLTDRPITPTEWLEQLAAGRSYITNGPLLEFTVEGRPLGSVLDRPKPAEVAVRGRAIGRTDFKRIELVRNGTVVGTSPSQAEGGHFIATLDLRLTVDAPAWLALRTPPPPVEGDPDLQEAVAVNEFGGSLFAHTSPIYVHVAGRGVFDPDIAQGLVVQMKSDMKKIEAQATFDDEAQRRQVMRVYEEAISVLEKRLAH